MAEDLSWRPRTGDIPNAPGVYRWYDGEGRLLYVGKAKRLRQRLQNYFAPLETLPERTRRMVTTARRLEWTVVANDTEAMQLEYTWIQDEAPPFNVRLKDDKSYPYMAITLGEEAPRVLVTRDRRIRGAKYFGPYPKVWAVNDTIEQMIRVFPIRTCNDANYKRAMSTGRPCFAGQIGRCGGPCSQTVTIEEHRKRVDAFIAFMETYDRSLLDELLEEMRRASDELRFEDAAKARDRANALETVLEKSAVVLPERDEVDVFGLVEDDLSAAVQLFTVRRGRVRGVRGWVLDKELDVETPTLVRQTLQRIYGDEALVPAREVLVPQLPEDAEALEEVFTQLRGAHVRLRVPQRGAKSELARTATINAADALKQYRLQRTNDYVARSDALNDIQQALGMSEAPLRIEAYDVSHLQGTGIVASMVVFEDGLPKKRDYRRFSIAQSRDDTDSMFQTLSRRLAHLDDDDAPTEVDEEGVAAPKRRFAYRPQLLLIDGGQPQVAAAKRALDDAGVSDIAIAGIAKRLEELWLPGEDFPVILPRESEALFLLQRLRDEAHRFAITGQRQKRSRDIRSQLAEIPGLGPSRIRALLRHFGSVARLRSASQTELMAVPGVGESTAAAIIAAVGKPTVAALSTADTDASGQ